MPDTSLVLPDVGENNTGVGTWQWNSPDNITDGNDLTVSGCNMYDVNPSNWLTGRDFDFGSLPSGRDLENIYVQVRRRAHASYPKIHDEAAKIWDSGAIGTSKPYAGYWSSSLVTAIYDHATDASGWNVGSKTTDDLDANFGFCLQADSDDSLGICYCAWLKMRVTYAAGVSVGSYVAFFTLALAVGALGLLPPGVVAVLLPLLTAWGLAMRPGAVAGQARTVEVVEAGSELALQLVGA